MILLVRSHNVDDWRSEGAGLFIQKELPVVWNGQVTIGGAHSIGHVSYARCTVLSVHENRFHMITFALSLIVMILASAGLGIGVLTGRGNLRQRRCGAERCKGATGACGVCGMGPSKNEDG